MAINFRYDINLMKYLSEINDSKCYFSNRFLTYHFYLASNFFGSITGAR